MKARQATLILMLFLGSRLYGQTVAGSVSGRVTDYNGAAIPFATVLLDALKVGVACDENGNYRLAGVPAGTYQLSVSLIGYARQVKEVLVSPNSDVVVNFSLSEAARELGEVTVYEEKSETQKVREQAYAVNSIDVKPLHNLNLDVNTVLNRSTGVRIRQEGGLGSGYSFSLNGYSGSQVRFFIDGLPADHLGSAMGFNNIPVNIIERIEVYKGVVPVTLGSDALGGAVNIITNGNAVNYLDAGYSYGSFNTHQVSLVSRNTFKKNYVFNANGFYNSSDNDYTIKAQVRDSVTGQVSDPMPFKLFNEGYQSGSLMIEGGVIKTRWADLLLAGLNVSANKKHYQRGRSMTTFPLGSLYNTSKAFTPTLKFRKSDLFTKGLWLSVSANYTYEEYQNVDTTSYEYHWDGSVKPLVDDKGNPVTTGSILTYYNHATVASGTLSYSVGKFHEFILNNTYTWYRRVGNEAFKDYTTYDVSFPFQNPNILQKNITGLSYKLSLWDNRWNTTIFGKRYHLTASLYYDDDPTSTELKKLDRTDNTYGGGMATSVYVTNDLLLKTSYEYATRMPETEELLGDGLFTTPNQFLEPETSRNFNFGALFTKRYNKHGFSVEGGFIYRRSDNLIQLVSTGPYGQFQNLSKARVTGGESSLRYDYKRLINAELNITYQDMRNINKTMNSNPDPLYLDRIPNIPYLFGNVMAGAMTPEFGTAKYRAGLNWVTMYVEEFYLKWPSMGSKDTKNVIPRQLSHDLSLSFSAYSGRYSVSLSCLNLLDAELYDYFKIQRPGRSFNVKLHFYLSRYHS